MWFVQQPHRDILLVPPVTSGWHAMIFSCPGQLKRWTCHSSTHWRFDFSVFRALHSCHWHMRHIRRRRRRRWRRCEQFSDFSDSVDYSWQMEKLESWHFWSFKTCWFSFQPWLDQYLTLLPLPLATYTIRYEWILISKVRKGGRQKLL